MQDANAFASIVVYLSRALCSSHLLSKLKLSLNFSMMGSVPPLKRPPAPNSPPRAPVGAASSDAIAFV